MQIPSLDFGLGEDIAALREAVQDGQREGCRLTGTRLGACQQIVTSKHGGNGLRLNGSGAGVALLMHGLDDGRGQVQFFKCHCCCNTPDLGAGLYLGIGLAGPRIAGGRASRKADEVHIKGGSIGPRGWAVSCPQQKRCCQGQLEPLAACIVACVDNHGLAAVQRQRHHCKKSYLKDTWLNTFFP